MATRSELRARATRLHSEKQIEKAARAYGQYLAMFPDDAGIWSNLGVLHRSAGRHDMALFAHRRATALAPDDLGSINNLANTLSDIGEYEESLEIRRRILLEEPDSLNQLAMIGRCLRGQGKYAEAAAHLEAAIENHPEDAELQVQLAFALLGQGDYIKGFSAYEARWRAGELKPRKLSYPQWQGEDLTGKTITVLPEQGFGDAVLFMRFLPVLKSQGAHVRLAVEGPMKRLFEQLDGADEVVPVSEIAESTDFWVNMMDLAIPGLLNGEIPMPAVLNVPQDSDERAQRITSAYQDQTKVGVVWTGSATYKGNAFRSFSHTDMLPLGDVRDVKLFSLYKGPYLNAFYKDGADTVMIDVGSSDRDFADCAAMMQQMDLVITSDTATAHIAGSLGVPTWVILHWDPFWVWTHAGDDTPWYPSVRLFRQHEPRDWTRVMRDVKKALKRFKRGA